MLLTSKNGRKAADEGRNGWRGVYFQPDLAFLFVVNIVHFPYLFFDLAPKQLCFGPGNGIIRISEKLLILLLLLLLNVLSLL